MKKLFIYSLFVLGVFIGCSNEEKKEETTMPDANRKVEVVENMTGGGYTFLKCDENGKEVWVAIREMPVKNGDVFYFTEAMEMKNFESKSLDKTFESILFVNSISKTPLGANASPHGSMPGMMPGADGHTKPKVEAASDINITPLTDGMTVEAVNRDKASLAGKLIKVKGKVTKYNGGIMNRNWIHIQDGTSHEGSVDITVTSDQSAKVGDVIIIEGTVAVDKDFGAGYFYDIIVENAKISTEENI